MMQIIVVASGDLRRLCAAVRRHNEKMGGIIRRAKTQAIKFISEIFDHNRLIARRRYIADAFADAGGKKDFAPVGGPYWIGDRGF